ncbi:MAG: glyoxalase [Pseudonocardiales bacterium]|nr:MAG: glyoxalase [Pseudonocardiales bacterium]
MTDHTIPVPAGLHLSVVAVDCAEPLALAGFWAALLGGTVEPDASGDATVHGPEGTTIDFGRVPEGKTVKNRVHLDLRCTEFDDAVDIALRLGATLADDIYAGGSWQVLRDPEGNEFCILRPRAENSPES